MIAIIRIKGKIGIAKNIEETLFRLRLRKKYVCVVLKESDELTKRLKRIQNFIAYGKISDACYKQLVEKRGKKTEKGIKPFFRLHPPRKGIKSKVHYPKGVLGNHGDKIDELIMRML